MFYLFKSNQKPGSIAFNIFIKNILPLGIYALPFFLFSCGTDDQNGPFMVESKKMTDPRDGQTYGIVKIGDQWWMAENLNYYTPSGSWYYNNDSATYAATYGRLYLPETATVENKTQNSDQPDCVCPPGWHIPTAEEWEQLIGYLGKYDLNGNDLKLPDSKFWVDTKNATNKTFFNAIPGGTVSNNGKSFANIRFQTRFLTATIDEKTGSVWGFGLDDDSPEIKKMPLAPENGWSVRCVKNNSSGNPSSQ